MDMTAYFMGRLAETSIPPGGLNFNIVEPATNETYEDTDIYNANGMNVVINGILEMIDGIMPTLSDLVNESISDCERTYNKTKWVDQNSGENQYPNAKAVYDYGQQIAQSRQEILVSGENIKTINGESVLGSGNINLQPTLVSGTNIKRINGKDILGSGNITISMPNMSNYYTKSEIDSMFGDINKVLESIVNGGNYGYSAAGYSEDDLLNILNEILA